MIVERILVRLPSSSSPGREDLPHALALRTLFLWLQVSIGISLPHGRQRPATSL